MCFSVFSQNRSSPALTSCAEKVFRKLQFQVSREDIDAIVRCKSGAIEQVLKSFQVRVTQMQQRKLAEQRGEFDPKFNNLSLEDSGDFGEEDNHPAIVAQKPPQMYE